MKPVLAAYGFVILLSACVPSRITVVHRWRPLVCRWEPLTFTLHCEQAEESCSK